MNKIEELKAKKNEIEAQITSIEQGIVNENHIQLINEALNLIDGVGIISGDYYAPDRIDSGILGIKNLRVTHWDDGRREIVVKITAPSGYLLPAAIRLRGQSYFVGFIKSQNYDSAMDY